MVKKITKKGFFAQFCIVIVFGTYTYSTVHLFYLYTNNVKYQLITGFLGALNSDYWTLNTALNFWKLNAWTQLTFWTPTSLVKFNPENKYILKKVGSFHPKGKLDFRDFPQRDSGFFWFAFSLSIYSILLRGEISQSCHHVTPTLVVLLPASPPEVKKNFKKQFVLNVILPVFGKGTLFAIHDPRKVR